MSDASRRLATIVALDVAGYSARTEADEAKATAEVAGLRGAIERIAKAHGGRVFNTAGDGFMLEFGSSLAAVEAAFELVEKCSPPVRIGVHVGDVVVQPNGDLLGHGVNVAARLMAQAQPGGALVSADVKRMIRGPIVERLVSRGPFRLDKMTETIEAFALVAMASAVVTSPRRSEPVLAVLPFDNQSNDPEMVFFSDGVSEEVLQIIARAQGIRVIGKGSSFQFRGDNKSVRKVANELQASHVLDGSVRRAGNQIRVVAHLVEATSQTTLWTERFDRKLSDVFELQDEIAGAIAGKLQTQISLRVRKPIDPAAYDLYLRARGDQTRQWAPEMMKTTEAMLEQAVAIAPDFAAAWGFLAIVRGLQIPPFRDGDGTPEHEAILAATRRALSLDPDCADAVWASISVLPAFSAYEKKLENTARAARLAPSDASILSNRAFALTSVGYVKDALGVHRHQAEIDPQVHWAQAQYATAMITTGQIDEGLDLLNAIHARDHRNEWIPMMRWVVLAYLAARDGRRMEEALASLEAPLSSVLAMNPLVVGITRMRAVLKDLLLLREKSEAEQEYAIARLLASLPAQVVSITVCHVVAALGHPRLALRLLNDALDNDAPIVGAGGGRANTTMALFGFPASPLRGELRFASLCAKLGLAQFWMSNGKWPDCAAEVPYDFKAECEKAAKTAGAP